MNTRVIVEAVLLTMMCLTALLFVAGATLGGILLWTYILSPVGGAI